MHETPSNIHNHSRSPGELAAVHTPEAVAERLKGGPDQSYLRDFIYGAIDGSVTTFAVVSGVAGAKLPASIVIIMGAANLFADGFSMAISNYLGTRAEKQERDRMRATERFHIKSVPEGEREEIRQIFAAKGFEGADLDRAVEIITSDDNRWIDTMLREEFGLPEVGRSAMRAALSTFAAFLLLGSVPLLPYLVHLWVPALGEDAFLLSTLMTAVGMFSVGAFKSRFVDEHWSMAGLETLAIGGGAAGLAYLVGVLLQGIGAPA